MSDTRTSDTKPKRAAREPAQNHAPQNHAPQGQPPLLGQATLAQAAVGDDAVAEVVAAATAAVIERNIVREPDPVSTIALTQAVPVGPACPVPATPEHSPAEKPAVSDKSLEAAAETAWTAFAEAQT